MEFQLPPDPRVGTVLSGRYRIDALLGEGGMGKVYLAEHVAMHKKLAVKVLHRELSVVPELVARFEREAMAAANIDHANVASATDFGKLDDDAVFIAFELVEGRCLRDVIAAGPIPVRRALGIARQMASALGAAQALSIVHRDLKPENVMLVERNGDPDFVKVLDFGVAKVPIGETNDGGSGAITRIGTVFGTPEYIPPEQALGQPSDGRSDLYSLGVILYEMLTGVRPFTSTSKVNLVGMHLGEPAPKLEDRAPGLGFTDELEAFVAHLLKKSASDRPQRADEVVKRIDELLGKPLRKPFPSNHGVGFAGTIAARLADLRALGRPLAARFAPLRERSSAAFERGVAAIERGRQRLPPPVARGLGRASSRLLAQIVLGLAALVFVLALIGIAGALRGSRPPPSDAKAVPSALEPTAASVAPPRSASAPEPAAAPTAPSTPAPLDASLEALLDRAKERANVKDFSAAVAASKSALQQNPAAKNDGRLASALFQAAQDKQTMDAAFELLEGPMQDKGAGIVHDLAVFAPKGSPPQKRAEAWLGSPRFTAVAAPALRLAVAMRRARSCKEVRALLPEVKAQGDKQSLPYLTFFKEHLAAYSCLKKDRLLDDTMRVINARAAKLDPTVH